MKIMVGYDQSNVSQAALELAKKHARAFNGKLYIVTHMVGGRDVPRQAFQNAEQSLKQVEALLADEKLSCETRLIIDSLTTGEALIDFAEEREIDEIFVGVKKRSKVGKLLLGSTAQYLIIKAKCPVMAVK